MNNQKGFTLMETLVTLVLVSLLLSLPVLSLKQALAEARNELFIQQVQCKLRVIQNRAIFGGENTYLQLLVAEKAIVYTDVGLQEKDERMQIPMLLQPVKEVRLTFKAGTGNVNQAQTLQFNSDYYQYRLIFQLGSGRYRYEKLKL